MHYKEMTEGQKLRARESAQTPGTFHIGSETVLGGMAAELDAEEARRRDAWRVRRANRASREAWRVEVEVIAEVQLKLW